MWLTRTGGDQALPGAAERGRSSLPAFSSVFVGREEVLTRLLELLENTDGEGPAGALLLGPTGMGKTRLLRELQVRAQVRDAAIHLETCREEDGPGALLYRLLERIAAESGGDVQDMQQQLARYDAVHSAVHSVGPAAGAENEELDLPRHPYFLYRIPGSSARLTC